MQKSKSKRPLKPTVAWRPSAEVMKILEVSQDITGLERTEIIEACIKSGAKDVVNKKVKQKIEEAKRAEEALHRYNQQS
jgi:hypothetical protein